MVMDHPLLNKLFCKKGPAIFIDCKGRKILFRISEGVCYRYQALEFLDSLAAEYGRLSA